MIRSSIASAGLALAVITLSGTPAASADVFEPISLASASSSAQADRADDPAVSANGRYVAFDGSFAGVSGVFRRDLLTGQVATVAEGDAMLPSISADGRYVSFTTTARLDEADDTNAAPDVYVRDMSDPDTLPCAVEPEPGESCAFTLASAVDGGSTGLSYTYSGTDPGSEEPRYGALAAGRSALSSNGRTVAFETTTASNLAGEATPALQVAVRDLDKQSTELVSVRRGTNEPVQTGEGGFGAIYPGGGQRPAFPNGAASAGASISADGSTVAWMGQDIEQQVPVLASEPHIEPKYAEPLWRRVAEGPGAPIRRVTGGGDPENPACAVSGEGTPVFPPSLADPCQGPFNTTIEIGGVWSLGVGRADVPRLSADGRIVAFASNAPEVATGETGNTTNFSDDLYVVDMADGLTRAEALRRLTVVAGGSASEPQRVGPIADLGISPDGSEVAFSTERTIFPLGSPTFVSAPATVARAQELFDVDLASDTLTRVTQSYEGGASEPAGAVVAAPSFSSDGNTLAFAATSNNLVYGDGNGASDAFVVRRKQFPAGAVAQFISPAPAVAGMNPTWSLGVSARSRPDGTVILEVQVPGAGALRETARSAVRINRCARRHHACHHSSTVVTRTVASKSVAPRATGLTTSVLTLARRYRALAVQRGGLSSYVTVTFSAPGHPSIHSRVLVTFHRTLKSRKRGAHGRTRKKSGARR
jgi:hypothetical protein